MKKLVLTGFLALIVDPGTLIRLFVAIVITFVMLMLQVIVSPMKSDSDNLFSFIAAVALAHVFIGSYAWQAKPKYFHGDESGAEDAAPVLTAALLMLAILVIALAAIVHFIVRVREVRAAAAREVRLLGDTQLLPQPGVL